MWTKVFTEESFFGTLVSGPTHEDILMPTISIDEIKIDLHGLEASGATQKSLAAFDLAGELKKILTDWDRGEQSPAKEKIIQDTYRDLVTECDAQHHTDTSLDNHRVHAFIPGNLIV